LRLLTYIQISLFQPSVHPFLGRSVAGGYFFLMALKTPVELGLVLPIEGFVESTMEDTDTMFGIALLAAVR
jgi:hypothetical protein